MSSTRGGGLPPRSGAARGRANGASGGAGGAGANGGSGSAGGSGGRRPPAAGKRKKSGAKRFWTIFAIVLILAVIGIGIYLGMIYQKSKAIGTAGEPVKPADTQPIAMALLGTDFRQETNTNLTDVVMVVAMNPKTDTATVVSLPRDGRFELDGYKVRKVNAYYPKFLVDEKKGGDSAKDEMKKMLGKYFGVSVDYATVVNFNTLKDVVDAVGGVEVNVDQDMCYKTEADNTDIDLKKGLQTLDGKQALGFARYRHTTNTLTMSGKDLCAGNKTPESSDIDRNKRQQELIAAILDKLKSFNAVTKAGSLIDAVAHNMDTDLENKQVMNLVRTYWDIPKENITYKQVTGPWSRKTGFVDMKQDELDAAKQALQDELAGRHQAASPAAP
ncbi:transcriptional regulator [Saccharibacillus sp. O23]|uniref:LCP family protein n=1 Tax=Saccharibacillus sp. O23 TaxID=2009338 RepID=UPI000B4E01B8|nr:LCP family protein [Saccharibacillus sp. O23]OWR29502.1 transcriptional regulator [Saccharibacillus sp. O23]